MFEIFENNTIHISRGDTGKASLFLNEGTDLKPLRYELQQGDKIYLGVMEPNYPFEKAIIKKSYISEGKELDIENGLIDHLGDLIVKFNPEDTERLKPGKYFYQVRIKFNDLERGINTVVSKTEFHIFE